MSEVVEGRNPVLETLRGKRIVEKILLAENLKDSKVLTQIKEIARRRGIPLISVSRRELDSIASLGAHQGVVAFIEPFSYTPFDVFLSTLDQTPEPIVLLLDGVEDPQNFGSLLRSVDAAGVSGVIISKRRCVGVTPAVCKASAGAVEHVPIIQVSNLPYAIDKLKREGFWIVGGVAEAEKRYFETDLAGKVGLVLGSEGRGISRLVLEKCDFLVSIPMHGKISSLNVAIAGALLMYEARRQRISHK
ncbi:MAG: 23S rRNA (guanosine(2251)-2'-O)-methyltransferase RlmB [Actinomycetota bacterium]